MENDDEYVEDSPNAEAQRFYDMLAAAKNPFKMVPPSQNYQ